MVDQTRVIGIINFKGGVAKSTTAINMSEILCRRYKKHVLLWDNDFQGNTTKFYSLFNPDIRSGSARILVKDAYGEDIICSTQTPGLDLITANTSLLTDSLILTQTAEGDDQQFRYRSFIDAYARDYDFVIIDNPPSIQLNVINALIAADDVIVPVKMEEWALDGMEIIADQIKFAKYYNPNIRLSGCLITIHRKNADSQAVGEEWLRKESGYPVFKQTIRYSARVDESIYCKQGIAEYSRRSAAAIDYIRFVSEYLDQIGGER